MIILVVLLITSNLAWLIIFWLVTKRLSNLYDELNSEWYKTCDKYVTKYFLEEHFKVDGVERMKNDSSYLS